MDASSASFYMKQSRLRSHQILIWMSTHQRPLKSKAYAFFCDQTGVYELTLEVNDPSVGTFFLRVTVCTDEGESIFGISSSVESSRLPCG